MLGAGHDGEAGQDGVLVKQVPNSGTPSTRLYAIGVTLPVWISAAAALSDQTG